MFSFDSSPEPAAGVAASPAPRRGESVDGEAYLEDLHVQSHDPLDLKCRKLMEINENLKYSLAIMDSQLLCLKKKQAEKTGENKKLKEKLKAKSDKETEIKRQINLLKSKVKKQIQGHHLICRELEDMHAQEAKARAARIDAQEKKNEMYGQYQQQEQEYKKLIYGLKELEGVDEGLEAMEEQNAQLRQRMEDLEEFLRERACEEQQPDRKASHQKVKELNEKVYELEKQEQRLLAEINKLQRDRKNREEDRKMAEEKTGQIGRISRKVQEINISIAAKKAELAHLDSMHKQLCIEESKLKKEYLIEQECLEEQRRYRHRGKADARKASQWETNCKRPQSAESGEISQLELQQIIQRYENIKSRHP